MHYQELRTLASVALPPAVQSGSATSGLPPVLESRVPESGCLRAARGVVAHLDLVVSRPAVGVAGRRQAGAQEWQSIALASMHHDPLLSSARKPFARFEHLWMVLAIRVPRR